MILGESGKSRLITEGKYKLDIIKQIRSLVDEGIHILLDDGILSYHEIDALAFKINKFLIRNLFLSIGNLKYNIWVLKSVHQ